MADKCKKHGRVISALTICPDCYQEHAVASSGLAELKKIASMASKVRTLQKKYFAGNGSLEDCKASEKELDQMLAEYFEPQGTLF